jgi:hypothetical protein
VQEARSAASVDKFEHLLVTDNDETLVSMRMATQRRREESLRKLISAVFGPGAREDTNLCFLALERANQQHVDAVGTLATTIDRIS